MKEAPDEIYFECPDCDDVTTHDVLKGKMGKNSLDATIKCQECGLVRTSNIRFPKQLSVNIVISSGATSENSSLLLDDDDLLKVGDEFNMDDGSLVKISGLELKQGKRAVTARATEI
ncbi:MAG: hypothetical protein FWD37_01810, partial [Methanomassiliicoccaceae archaeon]|nr:hypothetical protein [Methanomassiliicoccaceae archaeon]